MKKYLVIIKIETKCTSFVQRKFDAENPSEAIVKVNAYIKEHKWERVNAQVSALYEKIEIPT